jgi:NADH:ubiquinone oxidoreductase subunit 5 (subunit L)/multisubunit Na+/H+ antiporter MnhA subunit
MLKQTYHYRLILHWGIYTGIMLFLIWLSWQLGYLTRVFVTDPTRITYLISLLFIGGTVHCGLRACYLSRQLNAILDIIADHACWRSDDSLPAHFLRSVQKNLLFQQPTDQPVPDPENHLLTDIFAEEARSQHEFGWFVTSLLVKLGLLGTVVGFVLMLQPLSTLESFDIENIQALLTNMTSGMAVALNTTLVGLIASMLLSFQYLLLDRAADELIARTVHYMQTELLQDLRTHPN